MSSDQKFMAEAIRLAELGRYSTHPNPCVGCVIVRQGEVVGSGYHIKAGEAHAEANALQQAGDVTGCTVYVTLEPCSFHGRTPSCAEALIAAGVTRVVCASLDPDERNAGKGLEKMKAAGISVDLQPSQSADDLIVGHRKRYLENKPFVRLKLAMTLDGKTALGSGESKWITSEAARADVQKLRARSAAIVTGVQTVIDDDPALQVRDSLPEVRHREVALSVKRPVYVLDSGFRTSPEAQLLQNPANVVVCLAGAEKKEVAAEIVEMPEHNGRVSLEPFLEMLAEREHSEVLFECGATLGGSLVSQGLVDELVIYAAPSLIGNDGQSLLKLPEIDRMADLIDLSIDDVRKVGREIRISASLAK